MKTLITILLVLVASTAIAQRDSTTGAWMQPRTHDGKLWHDLPPPANLVNAGLFLEHSSKMRNSALYTLLVGGAAGALLSMNNPEAGAAVAVAGMGGCIYFTARGNRSQRKAGTLLTSGYQITNRYETIPDSVDVGPYMRIMPIR